MFNTLDNINSRPSPFEFYTAQELWADEHTSKQMLQYHLNPDIDVSSRNLNFIDRSAAWMISHFDINDTSQIIDFGCGPGLYTTRLAKTGAAVTGIDFSKNSLDYARRTANQEDLEITYLQANYLDIELSEQFDLITMIMCDYCALGPEQRKRLLQKFSTILKPDGSVLLDVYSLNSFNRKKESAVYEKNQLNGFWSPDDYYCFVNTFKYEQEKVMLDKYTIIEPERTRLVYNWLQHFSLESLGQELEKAGLSIEETYANVAGDRFTPGSEEFAVGIKRQG